MRDFLDYIHLFISKDDAAREKILAVVVDLYFNYIRPWYKFLRFSDESKLAKEVVRLRRELNSTGNLNKLKIKSRLLRSDQVIGRQLANPGIEPHIAELLIDQLEIFNHTVLAIFIAEIVERETIRERLRWITTALLGLATGLLTLLGVLYANR